MEVGVALTAVSKVLELLTVGLRGNFFYEFKLILTLFLFWRSSWYFTDELK